MLRFLKPTIFKIILTFVLLLASSYLWRMFVISRISDTFPHGFPFQFYMAWGPCPPGQNCSEFYGLFLLLDMIVWYFISSFIIERIQKKQ